ncbi:MAG: hypothetical protein NC548_25330 [Lachnospiraceae bacterium]|nr:hypothetical protein [Lachnospiraceae bacterium]
MGRRSFLSDLKYVKKAVERCEASERGEHVFWKLAGFVEAGSFTKSGNMKFLCQYWDRDYEDLGRIWKSQGYKEKNQETFRVQASSLGKMLSSLFPMFSREMFVAEEVTESMEEDFRAIELTVDALQNSTGLPEEVFISEAVDYADGTVCGRKITVDDCRGTIERLKPLMRSEVSGYLGETDAEQLKYIFSVLSKPLFGARSTSCDAEKLELLKAFAASESAGAARTRKKAERVYVEVPEKTPYNLSFGRSLADILTHRANDRMTDGEVREWQEMTEEGKAEQKRRLASLLAVFTEAGFYRQLMHYNPLAVQEVLHGDYPVREGETVYQFKK